MDTTRILVTGGTGLVGSAIKKLANDTGHWLEWIFVGSKDLDLSGDYEPVQIWFEKHHPTYVIHLAANVGGVYKNSRANLEMFLTNIRINDNILRACAQYSVEKVVFCLSTCIFPDKIEYPFVESQIHEGPPHPSNEGYAYAKRMLEVQARLYNSQRFGPQVMCVIPTNIYGPHDNFNLEDSHVIPGLIHRCYLAKRDNTPFVVRGSGQAIRQFIHSNDVADYIVQVLFVLSPQKIPNGIILAPQTEISIQDVAFEIADAFELPRERIQWDTTFGDGQMKKTANNALLRHYFPNHNMIDFRDGIRETVNWFKLNYDIARK